MFEPDWYWIRWVLLGVALMTALAVFSLWRKHWQNQERDGESRSVDLD